MAGRAGERAAYREEDEQARISQLEATQAQAQAPPPPPPASATGGEDVVAKLKQLAELKSSGALSQEEFDAAKAKLLGS